MVVDVVQVLGSQCPLPLYMGAVLVHFFFKDFRSLVLPVEKQPTSRTHSSDPQGDDFMSYSKALGRLDLLVSGAPPLDRPPGTSMLLEASALHHPSAGYQAGDVPLPCAIIIRPDQIPLKMEVTRCRDNQSSKQTLTHTGGAVK